MFRTVIQWFPNVMFQKIFIPLVRQRFDLDPHSLPPTQPPIWKFQVNFILSPKNFGFWDTLHAPPLHHPILKFKWPSMGCMFIFMTCRMSVPVPCSFTHTSLYQVITAKTLCLRNSGLHTAIKFVVKMPNSIKQRIGVYLAAIKILWWKLVSKHSVASSKVGIL